MSKIFWWVMLGFVVGINFTVLWAVVFWNNDSLFMFHWLAVPLSMLIGLFGLLKNWREL